MRRCDADEDQTISTANRCQQHIELTFNCDGWVERFSQWSRYSVNTTASVQRDRIISSAAAIGTETFTCIELSGSGNASAIHSVLSQFFFVFCEIALYFR